MHSPPASDGDGTAELLAFMSNAYWGTVVSIVLFGVSLCQGYFYFSIYNDRLALKAYVTFLLLLDVFSTVVWTAGLHKSLVLNWGMSVSPPDTTPFSATESAITLVITFMTQMFYAHRVCILGSNRRTTPIIIFIFALFSFVGGLARVIFQSTNPLGVLVTRKFKIVNGFENGFAALSDIVATIAMCFHFVETAMVSNRMTSVLRRLMVYTVNRGIIVTLVQLLILALYLSDPLGLTWIPFHQCIGKLYVNTFERRRSSGYVRKPYQPRTPFLLKLPDNRLNTRRRLRSNAGFSSHNESTTKTSTLVIQSEVDSADEGTYPWT
ncbi:hypothetical protein BD410DRAFT_828964 [Rickenella mellea]|uniref:DUF6534 domain-containing protein n=1 Tax=Rickenella mellea TaxID=50990 RepID=A0A4Y7Q3E5_9AGAM|nr:hypothetical protein BD410DRAFT_828964 [Rickenella mellea]